MRERERKKERERERERERDERVSETDFLPRHDTEQNILRLIQPK